MERQAGPGARALLTCLVAALGLALLARPAEAQLSQAEVMKKLYDTLFFQYTGQGSGWPTNTTGLFFSISTLGIRVNPKSYANAWSPINPTGSTWATELFSRLVDISPGLAAAYYNKGGSLEDWYGLLINNAQVPQSAKHAQVDEAVEQYLQRGEEVQKMYDRARFGDKPPSHPLAGSSKPLPHSVRTILAQARLDFESTKLASLMNPADFYHASYANPDDWFSQDSPSWSHMELTFQTTSKDNSSNFEAFGGPDTFGSGIWNANGTRVSASTTKLNITFDWLLVTIDRPWLNRAIFALGKYYVDGFTKGQFSNGVIDASNTLTELPLFADGFVVVKNLTVLASWQQTDIDLISGSIQSGTPLSYGSFAVVGTDPSGEHFSSTFDGEILRCDGLQIIGWTCSVVHACPPESPPHALAN